MNANNIPAITNLPPVDDHCWLKPQLSCLLPHPFRGWDSGLNLGLGSLVLLFGCFRDALLTMDRRTSQRQPLKTGLTQLRREQMYLHVWFLFSIVCVCVFITPFAGVVITYWWCCFKIQHHISRWYNNASLFRPPSTSHTHIDVFTRLVKVATCSSRPFLVHICFRSPFFYL